MTLSRSLALALGVMVLSGIYCKSLQMIGEGYEREQHDIYWRTRIDCLQTQIDREEVKEKAELQTVENMLINVLLREIGKKYSHEN